MPNIRLIPGLISLLRMAQSRKKRITSADTNAVGDPVSQMARNLHPQLLNLSVTAVREHSDTVRTYRLQSRDTTRLPIFQAGQYISVKLTIGNSNVSRAYTISSAPFEAESSEGNPDGYYEITVRRKAGGLVSNALWETWTCGTLVSATGPHGEFYVSPIRDADEIVAMAGGTGITPFVSMMKQFAKEEPHRSLKLLYGCRNECDVLFEKELAAITNAYPERFKRINTFENCADGSGLRKGYVDAALIQEHIKDPERKTYFICGPSVMVRFLQTEFPKIGYLERKQVRYEVSGAPDDVAAYPDYPAELKHAVFTATVIASDSVHHIEAKASEPLLVAVERAGLVLDSRCRSGECGICRSRLQAGEVFVLPDCDGRREADRELGTIHPCATYPLSDVTIVIPSGSAAQT